MKNKAKQKSLSSLKVENKNLVPLSKNQLETVIGGPKTSRGINVNIQPAST